MMILSVLYINFMYRSHEKLINPMFNNAQSIISSFLPLHATNPMHSVPLLKFELVQIDFLTFNATCSSTATLKYKAVAYNCRLARNSIFKSAASNGSVNLNFLFKRQITK